MHGKENSVAENQVCYGPAMLADAVSNLRDDALVEAIALMQATGTSVYDHESST